MTQHFLLSAAARTISVLEVAAMSDDEAFDLFKRLRWGDREEVACPHCGLVHKHYFRPARQIWRCAGCREDFSVTSKTLFAFHKLPLRVYLAAIAIFTNAVKGVSALQIARDLGVQHKSAYVLVHKLREALMVGRDERPLSGDVHVDGAYVGGSVRPENRKEDRVDRRLAENQNPDKRCVLVMRENHTAEERKQGFHGAKRTLAMVIEKETHAALGWLAPAHIALGSTISADESEAYDPLHARYTMRRVNHSQEYCSATGATNNQAESYFSRFRRMQFGQVHKLSPKYLDRYAHEVAYREDTRRKPNGWIFLDIARMCAHALTSRDWCGYWQGNKRASECLAA
jgi:transposase-like protein